MASYCRLLTIVFATALGCSSSTDPSDAGTSAVDSGSDGEAEVRDGGGEADAGPGCAAISGTYACTRKRSTSNPGSCSPTLTFNATMPVKIASDATSPSGFKVEVGYSDDNGNTTFSTCTNNIAGCTIFATCQPTAGTDQVTLTINGNIVSGTIARSNTTPACTVNFDISGARN
jgi:hypothetical protein